MRAGRIHRNDKFEQQNSLCFFHYESSDVGVKVSTQLLNLKTSYKSDILPKMDIHYDPTAEEEALAKKWHWKTILKSLSTTEQRCSPNLNGQTSTPFNKDGTNILLW